MPDSDNVLNRCPLRVEEMDVKLHEWIWRLIRVCLRVGLLLTVAAPFAAVAAQRYALLVGVSSYPSLPESLQLIGPQNDVDLMRGVLMQRGFAAQNIRVLADKVRGAHGEPTRAAIMNELKALAGRAGKGDFVVLFFAGHGSQQPARDLGPNNPEPDGLDEMFLPRDIGKWENTVGTVQNAIVDDELGAAITAIRNRGAFVWAIFDTCHSGTITRGIEDPGVRYRDVKPNDLGITDAALARAAKRAAEVLPRTRGGPEANQAPMTALQTAKPAPGAGGFVAFYAAQSWERAPEQPLPANLSAGDPRKRNHGVFSYTLSEVLAMNPAMTYRQAAQQVLQRYRARGQGQPTPVFEGPGLDAPVFGTQAGAQVHQWRISKTGSALKIDAGVLHQLAEGAIFSVVANPADPDQKAIGFLTATKVDVLQSELAPAEYGGKAKLNPASIPEDAYARLVNPNLALTLRVALPAAGRKPGPYDAKARGVLERLSKEKIQGLRVTWAPAGQSGDIRLALRGNHLWFLPPSAEIVEKGPTKSLSVDLAANSEAQLREKLIDSLKRIAKVVNLLRVAAQTAAGPVAQKLDVRISGQRAGKRFDFNPTQIPSLRDGDKLELRINNRHTRPIDVTILLIDSQYGITPLFPQGGEDNRIPAGGEFSPTGTIDITVDTVGRESLMVIAVEAPPGAERADFGFLAQARLERTRGRGQGIVEMLEDIGFATERTRGARMSPQTLGGTAIRLFTWNTVPK